jgi:hypothetical protein
VRAFNGNHSLIGEVLYQCDLLLGKGQNLLAVDSDCAYQLVLLEQWHAKQRPATCERGNLRPAETGERIEVTWFRLGVGDLNRLFRRGRACDRDPGAGAEHWVAPPHLGKRRRCIVHRHDAEDIVSLTEIHRPELGIANPGRVLQHRLEHRLQLAGRGADDA